MKKRILLFEDFISADKEIDMAELKRQANEIKHCGDYGNLFVNKSTGEVWWTAGDADGGDTETTSMDDIEKMLKSVKGVTKVEIEAEAYPQGDEFTQIDYKSE